MAYLPVVEREVRRFDLNQGMRKPRMPDRKAVGSPSPYNIFPTARLLLGHLADAR